MSADDTMSGDYYPLRDAEPDELAEELEARKQDARVAVDQATRALLNDDRELTEADVEQVEDVGIALRALANTLGERSGEQQQE